MVEGCRLEVGEKVIVEEDQSIIDKNIESEDVSEDADELTEEIEKDFFSTLASLRKKIQSSMMTKQSFLKSQSEKSKTRLSKEEKVTIGDIERKVMLEKGGKFE